MGCVLPSVPGPTLRAYVTINKESQVTESASARFWSHSRMSRFVKLHLSWTLDFVIHAWYFKQCRHKIKKKKEHVYTQSTHYMYTKIGDKRSKKKWTQICNWTCVWSYELKYNQCHKHQEIKFINNAINTNKYLTMVFIHHVYD